MLLLYFKKDLDNKPIYGIVFDKYIFLCVLFNICFIIFQTVQLLVQTTAVRAQRLGMPGTRRMEHHRNHATVCDLSLSLSLDKIR